MLEAAPAPTPSRTSLPRRQGILAITEPWTDRRWTRYTTALVVSLIALVLTYALRGTLDRVPFVLFYVAVSLAALIGGFGPALLVVVVAMLSVDYFMFEPLYSFSLWKSGELVPLLAFGLTASVISWLAASQRRLWRETTHQTEALQEQNIELEIQMEESQALQEELEQSAEEFAALNDELTRNRDFLAQAQSSAQLGSWEWDIKGDRITWSDQMFRVYGLEPGAFEVGFDKFSNLIHPEDRERVHAAIDESMRLKQSFAFDHRVVLPDGSVRWVHGRGRPVLDGDGQPIMMLGSGQDITERKRAGDAQRLLAEASEALASSLDYRQTLVTVANLAVRDLADWCSVAIGDETGRYENLAISHRDPERIRWIEEWQRLNPPRFDTPTGVPQVLRTGKPEFYPEITAELLEASASTAEERRVIRELDMRSAMVVPMIARGRTIGAMSFIGAESRRRYTPEDLWFAERLANRAAYAIDNARLFEEARTARAEAEGANAAKAQFLASMSHELRTPLNAIAGYAELMELGVLGPVTQKQTDALSRLQRSRKHLSNLVDQVLNFARIEAGKVQFDLTHVAVKDSLVRLAEMIAPQATAKGLAYDFDGCDPGIAVIADRDRLDQIILNLIGNAVKYTQAGGAISVFVNADATTVAISVRDTGPGIPAEKQQLIFQPFVQLGSSADATTSGVGLGLAISRDLARAMGGDVELVSRPPKGSTFTLRLPRSLDSQSSESRSA